jgi:hypothetical protein
MLAIADIAAAVAHQHYQQPHELSQCAVTFADGYCHQPQVLLALLMRNEIAGHHNSYTM